MISERNAGLGFALGRALGWAVAPLFGLVSYARRARTFHPSGPTYHATVTRHAACPPELRALAERLLGPALVRFSGALWKGVENVPDVLGCAIRLRPDERATAEAAPGDQDLLFATILRPWTMPVAPFTTNVRDYLGNDYFAVSPFDADVGYRVYLRLHPSASATGVPGSRTERLARAVEGGRAVLELEVGKSPFGPWTPLAAVTVERIARVDGEALRFRPFRDGRGVHPLGFVHAMRLGVYTLSQKARPKQADTRQPTASAAPCETAERRRRLGLFAGEATIHADFDSHDAAFDAYGVPLIRA